MYTHVLVHTNIRTSSSAKLPRLPNLGDIPHHKSYTGPCTTKGQCVVRLATFTSSPEKVKDSMPNAVFSYSIMDAVTRWGPDAIR